MYAWQLRFFVARSTPAGSVLGCPCDIAACDAAASICHAMRYYGATGNAQGSVQPFKVE